MNIKGPFFFSILIISFFVASYLPSINNEHKENVLMQTILGGIKQLHYNPNEINDDFSKQVYDLYIDRIDSGRRWLTQEEANQLKAYELQIDEAILNPNYEFFDLSVQLKELGIARAERFYADILSKPFDFEADEVVELDGDKKVFAQNEAELKEYWRKMLKYDVMNNVSSKLEKQEKAKMKAAEADEEDKAGEEEPFVEKTYEEIEKEAREDVEKKYEDWFKRLNKERRSDYLSHYLNAITNVFDPHTSYYLPKDKEDFDINMSGTLEGIGARLQTFEEYTKVISIVPGGPAWKGKELEVEDLILKVAQGKDEPVDVNGWRIEDVVSKIRGKKGSEVVLTVKRVDGTIEEISIIRDVVILDEGYAKSVILDHSGVDNIGYIKLPRFYADFNRKGGKSCFVDVAKEIEKLNAKNVNGIILDLRNNGGGSLRDVVRMSGLFIEEGPIVQVKARNRKPEVLEDEDPRVQYDGPLIVMVNQFSASASEILAAALQDYGRAVIVGTKSTFGKGTVQRFYDLDNAIRGNDELKPLGEVKMTIQKFYRVNGGSTQLKGVTPDIVLPDNFTYIKTGEQDHDHAMEWSEIPAVDYKQKVYSLNGLGQLKANSEERLANSEVFQKVLENAARLKRQRDKTSYPLNLENYQNLEEEMEAEADKYEDLFVAIEDLKISNLAVDLEKINADESKKARNDDWIETLQKDAYVEESLMIMKDMIENN